MAETDPTDIRVELFKDLSRKILVLTSSDVSTVVSELSTVAEKWHEIGTQFRLSALFLDGLKGKEGQEAKTSLQDMVGKWLGGGSPRPTWKALRNALKHESVDEETIAEKLTSKYAIDDRTSDATTVPYDASLPFGCGVEHCICQEMIVSMNKEAGQMVFPDIQYSEDVPDFTPQKRRKLELEYREVLAHYDDFSSYTWKGLVRKETEVSVLVTYLEGLKLFQTYQRVGQPLVPLLTNAFPVLRACVTLSDVYLALRDQVTVFNNSIMVDILLNMAGNTRDRNELDNFRDKYYSYMRRKATLFPTVFAPPTKTGYAMMRFTILRDIDDVTLSEADSFSNRLTYNLDLSRFSLKLVGLLREGKGAVTYVYQVPNFAPSLVFPMTDKQVDNMRIEKITAVACCSYRVDIEVKDDDEETTTSSRADKAQRDDTAMEVEAGGPNSAPLYASLPADSPFRLDEGKVTVPPKLAHMQAQTTGTVNYVGVVPRASDKALYAAMVLCQHAAIRRRGTTTEEDRLVRCVVVANTKSRAHELVEELEGYLPRLSFSLTTGTETDSIAQKLKEAVISAEDLVLVCTAGKLGQEVESEVLSFASVSLMLVDDCQHAMRHTFLEAAFHKYIVDKVYRSLKPPLPVIVGMTCNPGERADALDEEAMQKHLLKVAGGVNSVLGLLFTDEVTSDTYSPSSPSSSSSKPRPKPDMLIRKIQQRDPRKDVVVALQVEVCRWEDTIDLGCPYPKWSSEYAALIQSELEGALANLDAATETTPPALVERVRVLELIQVFVQALKACLDYGMESAVSVLQAPTHTTSSLTTARALLTDAHLHSLDSVRRSLELLLTQQSPTVAGVVEVVCGQFAGHRNVRGFLFVDSLSDAHNLAKEISKCKYRSHAHVIPRCLLARYATDSCSEVEKAEQTTEEVLTRGREGIEAFHNGDCRLLIIPYAIESDPVKLDGLESEYDFIARLHKVSRRDNMVETEYVLSFLSSNESRSFPELRKEFDMCRVEAGLRTLPTGPQLSKRLTRAQEDVMFAYQSRSIFTSLRPPKKQNGPGMDQIQLRCKKCRVYVCHGMEVFSFFVDGGSYCVVPHRDFDTRYHTKPYLAKHKVIKRVNRLRRMFCNNCGAPWGVLCHFPAKGCQLPVIKSRHFIFEMNRKYYAIKLWSDALFRVPPLTAYPKFHIHGPVEMDIN